MIGRGKYNKEFSKFFVRAPGRFLEIMKLSPEYVENPETEQAFLIGKFSLKSITDQHPSLTQNISLEVHFTVGESTSIKDVFWVA